MRSFYVKFECRHFAHILPDEHGDGSAWCQGCGEFRDYEDVLCGASVNGNPCERPAGHDPPCLHSIVRYPVP